MTEQRDFWDIPTIKRKLREAHENYINALNLILEETLGAYYTQTEVDGLIENFVTQAVLNSTLTNYVLNSALNTTLQAYYTQTEVDGLIENFVTQAVLNSTLTNYVQNSALNTTLGAYYTQTEVDNLLATMQSQIDTLQQAVIDCGCLFDNVIKEFDTDDGGGHQSGTDWTFDWNQTGGNLRLRRYDPQSSESAVVSVPIDRTIISGLLFEFSFNNAENIQKTDVLFGLQLNEQPAGSWLVFTGTGLGTFTQSIDLDIFNLQGYLITSVGFWTYAADGQATTFARWTVNYVRLIKP